MTNHYLAFAIVMITLVAPVKEPLSISIDIPPQDSGEYSGTPYQDTARGISLQNIPGELRCAFYDIGGEGIAYHDVDSVNSGSGGLNKGPGYLDRFRMNEAVDISYTKFHDSVDNSPYNKVEPHPGSLYLGWTEPGEWTKYTVEVMESGNYRVGVMYTSNRGGGIRLFVDKTEKGPVLEIPTTFDPKDPKDWRQWHHWNYIDSVTVMHLNKGRAVLKLEIAEKGNFNFEHFQFKRIE
jgi:hypothetical protein